MKNIIVAQSGGPTTAINSSITGLILDALDNKSIDKVYGSLFGIHGVLVDKILLFNDIDRKEIELMKTTPSSALGSCRIKLNESHYEQIFNTFKKYNIGMFFYAGGNDSMDTVDKLSAYANKNNIDVQFIGVPKTIDNDLVEIDHTPGFGSCAKFLSTSICEMNRDAIVYDKKSITIVEVMGRDTGWIAASTGICSKMHTAPDLIYIPEITFTLEKLEKDVLNILENKNSCFIVVSEGIKYPDGNFVADSGDGEVDNFGHKKMGGVHSILKSFLSSKTNATIKSIEFNIQQRCSITTASKTDIDEAYILGKKALEYGLNGKTGIMSTITRCDSNLYDVKYDFVDVSKVANNIKYVPNDFFNENGTHLSEKGLNYFEPLVIGNVDVPYDNGLPIYSIISPIFKNNN